MDNRRRLVSCVLYEGVSLSEACRHFGVTRPTGRKWVLRAQEVGVAGLAELSRAPKSVPARTCEPVEKALADMKTLYPEWGARKLCPLLRTEHGIELPVRTADHILKRLGMTTAAPAKSETLRFERDTCGALLQTDFKGMPKSVPYAVLSVLDDHARFCFSFEPIPDKTGASVKASLWETFAQHGLPEQMLMDNGDCWGSHHWRCPTAFEAWLMLLQVKPIHGKPRHPQTQGKVERFHLTAKIELKSQLAQPSVLKARPIYKRFVDRYNWVRPHDAIAGKTPGSRYAPFPNKRPDRLPEHHIPEGAVSRKVDQLGFFSYAGRHYKMGKGLIGQRVVLAEAELGMRVFFAGFPLPYLFEL